MEDKRLLTYLAIAVIISYGAWWGWEQTITPDYRVITEKPIFGNLSSQVVVIEFGDIQCPACKAVNPTVQQIKEKYKDKIQFRYLHFPLVNIHKDAMRTAEAIECANDFGKFFEYIDKGYELSPDLSRKNLIKLAETMGIPKGNFTACLDSGFKSGFVEIDLRDGQRRGVNAIPAIFINDRLSNENSYYALTQLIEEELS